MQTITGRHQRRWHCYRTLATVRQVLSPANVFARLLRELRVDPSCGHLAVASFTLASQRVLLANGTIAPAVSEQRLQAPTLSAVLSQVVCWMYNSFLMSAPLDCGSSYMRTSLCCLHARGSHLLSDCKVMHGAAR